MPSLSCRRSILRTGLVTAAALGLPKARACEFYAPNFKLIHPWTRASLDGADEALVSMVFDDVTAADVLVGVLTPVAAGACMGGTKTRDTVYFDIAEGQRSALSEDGTHLRLLGLRQPLAVGCAYPMTLVLRRAGPLQAQLTVDYARFL